MPRLNGNGSAPRWIEDTLLVVEPFRASDGTEYHRGDRVQLRHRKIRQVALERPEFFAMEFPTLPVDMSWLVELDRRYGENYAEAQRVHGSKESRRKEALLAEHAAQGRRNPDQHELERRFKEQEAERERREAQRLEERKRESEETALAAMQGEAGFHFTNP